MKQPDGYKDRTGHICYLKKTLYGLKQAVHEWNKEFDRQIHTKGFHQLKSDPCPYIWRNKEDLSIITIWVDDLLSFTNLDEMKAHTKKDLESIFELVVTFLFFLFFLFHFHSTSSFHWTITYTCYTCLSLFHVFVSLPCRLLVLFYFYFIFVIMLNHDDSMPFLFYRDSFTSINTQ